MLADALAIWHAGVAAVKPERLILDQTSLIDSQLYLADEDIDLADFDRILVVGAGKASAAMASALFQHRLSELPKRIAVTGWVNAPAGSFQPGSAGPIVLHAARPAGANEPTEAAVQGTDHIVQLLQAASARTLCLVLLSGGGSAILVSPIEGIELSDKQQIARRVAAVGGNIEQLNTVRRALSRVKGGGLLRQCSAGRLVSLILSDVLGDPLETIASGPTVASAAATPEAALATLRELGLDTDPTLSRVVNVLKWLTSKGQTAAASSKTSTLSQATNIVVANNATAVDAAGVKAVELGYRYIMQSARSSEGDVAPLAAKCAGAAQQLSSEPQVDCWISGGEPTVTLPEGTDCGLGGRNQQLALLTMLELQKRGWPSNSRAFAKEILFLSAGTDGEDGPTDAAGAWFDADLSQRAQRNPVSAEAYARHADAYHFFDSVGGLVRTGPTGTNVCDLRIALTPRS